MASVQSPPSARRRLRRKGRALPLILTLALIGGLGWWGWAKMRPAENENGKMLTAEVTRGDLVESVSATGSVVAQTGAQVKIGSQITGRIERLYADVGSKVKAGQLIAELDLPDIEAQVRQAEANVAAARLRLTQQQSGVAMQRNQTASAVAQAQAELRSAKAQLQAAQAASRLQASQTPTTIQRAESDVKAMKAALSTARSTQKQVETSANLQVATAQEQLRQARANAENSAVNLGRQEELLKKGFVAASLVDTARATNTVNQSQVAAAQQNVKLIREQIAADIQASRDRVTQAQQDVESAESALEAAKAGKFQDRARLADVDSARARVRQAEANLGLAKGNTTQNLLKEQDVSQAQEALRVSQAQLDIARAQLDKTYIRSPISGTVLQLASQQGETLAAGLSAPTLIIVADLKRLQVDVYVDETDIGRIKLGQKAEITVDAFPGKPFFGKVQKIASGSTVQQGVITYGVTLAIDNPEYQLKPDMTASVTIETGRQKDVLLVPSEAVKVGVNESTVHVVTMKDGKQTAEPRPVKAGASDGIRTEILEGLKEGQTIVLAGMDDGRERRGGNSPFGPRQRRGR